MTSVPADLKRTPNIEAENQVAARANNELEPQQQAGGTIESLAEGASDKLKIHNDTQ